MLSLKAAVLATNVEALEAHGANAAPHADDGDHRDKNVMDIINCCCHCLFECGKCKIKF